MTHENNFIASIEKLMAKKPAYKWHYNELAEALNFNPEDVKEQLEELTESPNNNTRIKKTGDEGYYVLSLEEGVQP